MATAVAVRPARAPRPKASWPGLSDALSAAASQVMAGRMPDFNQFHARAHTFYHRVDYATGGQANLSFFNVSPSDNICNLPTNGALSQESFFLLQNVRIWAQTGITAAATYTRAAAGAQATNGAATTTVITVVEELRTILEAGLVSLKVGDRNVIDKIYGIANFPQGGGVVASTALSSTSATATKTDIALLTNGVADSRNGFTCRPYFPILPGKQIKGLVEWQAALAVTTAFVMRFELDGILVTPANN